MCGTKIQRDITLSRPSLSNTQDKFKKRAFFKQYITSTIYCSKCSHSSILHPLQHAKQYKILTISPHNMSKTAENNPSQTYAFNTPLYTSTIFFCFLQECIHSEMSSLIRLALLWKHAHQFPDRKTTGFKSMLV